MQRDLNQGGRPMRAMPADFAEVAWLSHSYLVERFKTGSSTIKRWREELGGESPYEAAKRPPADFAALVERCNITQLCAHYRVGERRIKSWAKIANVQLKAYLCARRRNVPDDFADVAPTMTKVGLMKHYRADQSTIGRWIDESGIGSMVYVPAPPPRQSKPFVFGGHARNQRTRDLRRISMFDEAADVLRRERFVVFRCGPTGKYLEKGLHWRVGNIVLTPDELLQRAEKYRRKVA